ncbi:MAG: hypothetical protein WC022_03110 [Parcubacteria group bacterium]
MNILNKLKKIKEFSKPNYLFKYLLYFSGRYIRGFTFLIALAAVAFCVYLWYGTIYRPQWNENQKKAYIKDKSQGIVFNEKGFEYDTAAAKDRAEESRKDLSGLTDIFRLKKQSAPPEAKDKTDLKKPSVQGAKTSEAVPVAVVSNL